MPGDYSRFTDNWLKRFERLLMQQGKVQLDADWNEAIDILARRDRLQSVDTFGKAAVPRATTPDAFKLTASGKDLKIGPGRLYVDGLLVEAFPEDNPSYLHQPFVLDPVPPLQNFPGTVLAYLDVWQREVTYVEDPGLLEPALGGDIDTSTRFQTVWQLKIATGAGLKCRSDLYAKFPPTDAQLTVSVNVPADPPDPCQLPDVGGFRDVENRHYRVQVHDATRIKFARDPVVSPIEGVRAGNVAGQSILTVRRIGRDPVLRFEPGNFVEVGNDAFTLDGQHGIWAQIVSIDEAAREVTINAVVTNAQVDKKLHPYLIRWDGKGLLTIPGNVELEAGIFVNVTGTKFRTNDYWVFAARASTGTAGPLVNAPPRGIAHHYVALAMVSIAADGTPTVLTDCRVLWPPECDCDCTVCVSPESHASGELTIQDAIDLVKKTGRGGKICLKPGLYAFEIALQIVDVDDLRITGHGQAILVYTGGSREAIFADDVADLILEDFGVIRAASHAESSVITLSRCWIGTVIRNCAIYSISFEERVNALGIALHLALHDVLIEDCDIAAEVAIGSFASAGVPLRQQLLFAFRVSIRDCLIFNAALGIRVAAEIAGAIEIAGNTIVNARLGIDLWGVVPPAWKIDVTGNHISGDAGIVARTDRTSITNNILTGRLQFDPKAPSLVPANDTASGIRILTTKNYDVVERGMILENRIGNFAGAGILVITRVDGLLIKQNFIERTLLGGIVLRDGAKDSRVTIDNNELRDVCLGDDKHLQRWNAVRIAPLCDVALIGNRIENVGLPPLDGRALHPAAGIAVESPRVARIHQNRIAGVAAYGSRSTPAGGGGTVNAVSSVASAGIELSPPAGISHVTDNVVTLAGFEHGQQGVGHAYAFRLREPSSRHYSLIAATPQNNLAKGHFLLWTDFAWVHFIPAQGSLIVRSNHFEGRGLMRGELALVEVIADLATCNFSGNVCMSDTAFNVGVLLSTGTQCTFVAESNQVVDKHKLSVRIDCQKERWTVLGNIVLTGIEINGGGTANELKDPWKALNRT